MNKTPEANRPEAHLPSPEGVGLPPLESLVDQYYGGLYRFAYSLAGNEADASDLTQQTYYLVQTRGHQVRDPDRIKSWLFTTLYREFIRRRRHETRFPKLELGSVEHELPAVRGRHVESLDASTVVALLEQLDDVYRLPLTLFYLREFSYNEIAEMLGIPIGTVMSRLSRGKRQLRQRLAEQGVSETQPSAPKTVEMGAGLASFASRAFGRA